MELLKHQTGTDIVHIAFKGGGPQVISAVSGETAIIFTTVPASIQHLRSGRLIGLGVSTLKRDPSLPEVPAIAESGLPGYEFYEWQAVVAPTGTPAAIITKLNREIARTLEIPEVKKRIAGVGAQTVGGTPEELAAFIKKEIAMWAKVVKAAAGPALRDAQSVDEGAADVKDCHNAERAKYIAHLLVLHRATRER
jgi:tripartite-type tricarboxylate transporter receptor subunit TctC